MKHYTSISDHRGRPVTYNFKNVNVTAHGGAPLLLQIIQKSPLLKKMIPLIESLNGRDHNPFNTYSNCHLLTQLLMMIGHGLQNLTDAPDMNKDPLIKDMLGKAASAPTL